LLPSAHTKGINGVDYQASLASADQLASQLMERLAEHSLMDCVDLLFISDHGIANYNGIAYPAIALKENFGDAAKKINIEEVCWPSHA
jgi:Type I phosphodiesterase / nucleotide pyrophosphatase